MANVRFPSLESLDRALEIFSKDAALDIVLLNHPHTQLGWDADGFYLHVPPVANGRVQKLLERYEIPYSLEMLH